MARGFIALVALIALLIRAVSVIIEEEVYWVGALYPSTLYLITLASKDVWGQVT